MRIDHKGEPIFVDLDQNPLRPDKELVPRKAVTALVRNPKTGLYLCLKWKTIDWDTFITGGIEGDQTAEEAARDEVRQETGYRNLRLVAELPPYCSLFYHGPKGVNRQADWTSFLFELADDERDPVGEAELAQHEPVWLSAEDLKTFRLHEGQRYLWDYVVEYGL